MISMSILPSRITLSERVFMKKSILVRRIATCTLLISTTLVMADEPVAADPAAGKVRSALCMGCHGLNGEGKAAASGQPAFPRIAGQIQGYFVKSVKEYKADVRKDPLMGAIAKGLNDADIANLAAFYASLK